MTEPNKEIVIMKGIHKSFLGVQALENVDFTLNRGEIHALVGENGAGKTTLIKILTGVEQPDAGTVMINQQQVTIRSPQQAQELGISTVYQEVNLCPHLSVAENILLGREVHRFGFIDRKAMNTSANEILQGLGVNLDVTQTLGACSVAVQQMAAIARALEISSAKVLVLDEPTSSLDVNETEQLFNVMRKLRSEGVAIIFITHFLNQVYEVADRITILRNGNLVGTYIAKQLSHLDLITKMIGRSLTEYDEMVKLKKESRQFIKEEAWLEADKLGREGAVEPFDLSMHAGEVVGLAGLLGSGRTEIAQLLFGIDNPTSGSLDIDGKEVKDHSPLKSIGQGVALCPEDRKAAGIVGELTVRENIILAMQAGRGWFRYLSQQEQYTIADKYIKLLNIATPSADQPVKNLSGGNQQKVILARWLATNPRLLILDEPTRGIDVGTKAEIQRLVLSLAEEGKSCIFISSELEEVLRTSHRVAIIRDHKKVAEFNEDVPETKIMQAIAGSIS
ncbi:MAG TPA: sugar ABC transporter ATP-binding protein [Anaerolineales bacterium]|nr:sugar ABC transporter ATP-binding protein [Anaerolineales bacterium]